MAFFPPIFSANPQRSSGPSAHFQGILSAFIVLVLLFSVSGVLVAPTPAEAAGKGLGSAPSSSSESSQPSEKSSPSESSDGGLTDSGSGTTESSAPKSPDAAKAESAPTPTRVEAQAVEPISCAPGVVYSINSSTG